MFSLSYAGPGARSVIWPLEYKRSIRVENAVFQANKLLYDTGLIYSEVVEVTCVSDGGELGKDA